MVTYPKDWDCTTLGNLGEVKMCKRIFQSQTRPSGEIPFYKIGTFGGKADAYISRELYEYFKELYSFPTKGDVLISAAGTIGHTVVYDGKDAYFQDSNIVWLDVNPQEVDKQFLKFFYQSYPWVNLEGTTISRLYNGIIQGTPIHLPAIPEQSAIARALNAFDTYIDNLAELIEKKKAIRDGALEDLMSGRTRLDGFSDRWNSVRLGEICSLITKGTTPLDKSGRGNINFIKVENIDPSSGNIRINQKITTAEHTGYLKRSQLQVDDILFSIAGTLGRVAVIKDENLPANTNQALAIIRLKAGHRDYVKYFLTGESIKTFIKENPTVGAQPNLSLKQVGSLEIKFPSMKEQEAIADVLTAMDDEISALEDERNKMIQIREGAMDDLLTGRVRLKV